MSNYLAHLAARITNPTGGVQPRLAARFEPSASAATPAATTLMTSSHDETSAVSTANPPDEEFSSLVPPSSSPVPTLTDAAIALDPPGTTLAPALSEYQEFDLPYPSATPSASSLTAATAAAGLTSPPLPLSESMAPILVNPIGSMPPTHSANVPFQPEGFSLEPLPSNTSIVKPSFQPQAFYLETPNSTVLAADAPSVVSTLLPASTDSSVSRVPSIESKLATDLSEPLKPGSPQPKEVAKTVNEISQPPSLSVTDANLQPAADHPLKSPPPAVAKTGILNIALPDSAVAALTESSAAPSSQPQPERALDAPALQRRSASAESNPIPGIPTVRSIVSQVGSEALTPAILPVPQSGTPTPAAAVLLDEPPRSSPLLAPRSPSTSAWVTPKAIAPVESVPSEAPTVPPSPQVNVSIGRIEVRLKPPPRQPARPARRVPPANITSLSDYLRQGGQR